MHLQKYHVTLVLKGPHTLISDGNETYRIMSGNKGMSSAGMGIHLLELLVAFRTRLFAKRCGYFRNVFTWFMW